MLQLSLLTVNSSSKGQITDFNLHVRTFKVIQQRYMYIERGASFFCSFPLAIYHKFPHPLLRFINVSFIYVNAIERHAANLYIICKQRTLYVGYQVRKITAEYIICKPRTPYIGNKVRKITAEYFICKPRTLYVGYKVRKITAQ